MLLPTADGWSMTHASQRRRVPVVATTTTTATATADWCFRDAGEEEEEEAEEEEKQEQEQEEEEEEGWTVHVEFNTPLLGKVLSYDGSVAPSSRAAPAHYS